MKAFNRSIKIDNITFLESGLLFKEQTFFFITFPYCPLNSMLFSFLSVNERYSVFDSFYFRRVYIRLTGRVSLVRISGRKIFVIFAEL